MSAFEDLTESAAVAPAIDRFIVSYLKLQMVKSLQAGGGRMSGPELGAAVAVRLYAAAEECEREIGELT